MNDVSLDALRGEPARQPEAVVSGLERDGDAVIRWPFFSASARQRRVRAQEGVNSLKVVRPHAAAPQCAPEAAGAAATA
jgi:hypothetical protein